MSDIRTNLPSLIDNLQPEDYPEIYSLVDNMFATYIATDHIKLGYKIKASDIYDITYGICKMLVYGTRIFDKIHRPFKKNNIFANEIINEHHFGTTWAFNRQNITNHGLFTLIDGSRRVGNNVSDQELKQFLLKIIHPDNFLDQNYQSYDNTLSSLFSTDSTNEIVKLLDEFIIKSNTKIKGDNTRNFILQILGYATQLRDTIILLLNDKIVQYLKNKDLSTITITDIPSNITNIDDNFEFYHNYAVLTKNSIGNDNQNGNNFIYNYDYPDYANKIYVPTDHTELSGLSHTAVVNICLGTDGCLSNYFQLSAYSEHFRALHDEDRFHPSGRCKFRTKIIVSDDSAVSSNYRNGNWIKTGNPARNSGAYNAGIVGLLLGVRHVVWDIINRFTTYFTNLNFPPDGPPWWKYKYRIRYYFNNSGGNTYYDDEFYPMFSLYKLKNFFDIWDKNEYGQTQSEYNGVDYYWSIHGPNTYNQDFKQTANNIIICAPKSSVSINPSLNNDIYTLSLYPVWAFEIIYHFDYNFDSNRKYTAYVTMNMSNYNVLTVTQAENKVNIQCIKPTHPYKYTWKYYNNSATNFSWKTETKNWSKYTDNTHWVVYDINKNKIDNLYGKTKFTINQIKNAKKIHLFPSFYVNSFTVYAGKTIIYGADIWGGLRYYDLVSDILPSGYSPGQSYFFKTKAAAESAASSVKSNSGRGGPEYSYNVGGNRGSFSIIRKVGAQVSGVRQASNGLWYFAIIQIEKVREEHREIWSFSSPPSISIRQSGGNYGSGCGGKVISKVDNKYITIPSVTYKKTNKNKTLDDEVTWTET